MTRLSWRHSNQCDHGGPTAKLVTLNPPQEPTVVLAPELAYLWNLDQESERGHECRSWIGMCSAVRTGGAKEMPAEAVEVPQMMDPITSLPGTPIPGTTVTGTMTPGAMIPGTPILGATIPGATGIS